MPLWEEGRSPPAWLAGWPRLDQERQDRIEAGQAKNPRDIASTRGDSQPISVGCRPVGSIDQYPETTGVDKCQLAQVHHDLFRVTPLRFEQSCVELGAPVQIELPFERDHVLASSDAGVNLESKILLGRRDLLDRSNVRKSGGDSMFRGVVPDQASGRMPSCWQPTPIAERKRD